MLKGKLLEMWQPQPQRLSEAEERAQMFLEMWPIAAFQIQLMLPSVVELYL